MKLAELLIERAETKRRISIIASRLTRYAKVQEGDEPPFEQNKLLKKMDALIRAHEEQIKKINKANMSTELEPGMTLADAICKRDILRYRRSIYSDLFSASLLKEERYSRNEIRYVSTLDVDMIMDVTDNLAQEIRLLDGKIQSKNWEVEV